MKKLLHYDCRVGWYQIWMADGLVLFRVVVSQFFAVIREKFK